MPYTSATQQKLTKKTTAGHQKKTSFHRILPMRSLDLFFIIKAILFIYFKAVEVFIQILFGHAVGYFNGNVN